MHAYLAVALVFGVLFFVLAIYFFIAASSRCQANPSTCRKVFNPIQSISRCRCLFLSICVSFVRW